MNTDLFFLLEHELYSCSRRYSEFNSDHTQANECNSFTNTPLFQEDPVFICVNLLLEHELYSCSRRYSEFNSDHTQANECNSFTNTPLF